MNLTPDLEIVYLDPHDLTPYENNARKHGDVDVQGIKDSIETDGFNDPIGIWGDNNLIVEGHGRQLAAIALGMEKVPCIRLDHLTDAQRRDYAIRHNRTAELSEWDEAKKQIELEALAMEGFDVGELFEPQGEQEHEIVEDEVPEVPEEPRTKLGDIYQLGNHRLICGDSTDSAVIDRLMDGAKADCVFTDPPYGMKYTIHRPKEEVRFEMLQNDDKILDFFPCVEKYSKGFVFVCTTWKVLSDWLPLFKKYLDLSNMIIWNKGGGGIGDLKTTFSVDYEIILCASRKNQIIGKRIGSVWDCGRDNAIDYKHPTQKPVGLSAIAIEHTTNKGQCVLDLFGGSGSTLIACEQLNRKCYMAELDPKYCDVIVDRWEKFTGEKAVLIDG